MDYSENKEVDFVVKTIIEKIKARSDFDDLLIKHKNNAIKNNKLK